VRIRDINALSAEDRANKLADLRIELARFRTMVNAGGAVENPTRIRELRRTIAQILTIENEKKLGIRQTAEMKQGKQEKKAEKTVNTPRAKKTTKELPSK
jgi:large subunit ribosomal protein L29